MLKDNILKPNINNYIIKINIRKELIQTMKLERVVHSLAVAKKMKEIGKEYNLQDNELEDLFTLGLNHDIGYEFTENGVNHEVIGGEILKRNGYKYWKEVYYHGRIPSEYNSVYLEILNKADMQIDGFGADVGYENRLLDIKNRHGEDSEAYKRCKKLIESIVGH